MQINIQAIAAIPNQVIPCTVGGSSNEIRLTTGLSLSSLNDGMRFSFTPLETVVSLYNVTEFTRPITSIIIDGLPAKELKAPDGYSYALPYDIQKDKPIEVTYLLDLDVCIISSPQQSFRQALMPNGTVKLQAASATGVNLTQNDGQSLVMGNSENSSFRNVSIPVVIKSSLFTNVNYYEGTANQSLPLNKLLAVNAFNKTPTNDQDIDLDFYRMYTGVGSEAWTPTTTSIGILTKRSAIGSHDHDNSRHHVGIMWTGDGDISTLFNGPIIRSVVQSHYNLWPFPAETDLIHVTSFTSGSTALQSTPRAEIVTEGLLHVPFYEVFATYKNSTVGAIATLGLSISGTTYDGSAFSATSKLCSETATIANKPKGMYASWGVAVPMGFYIAKPILTVDSGTASFDIHMKVHFAN